MASGLVVTVAVGPTGVNLSGGFTYGGLGSLKPGPFVFLTHRATASGRAASGRGAAWHSSQARIHLPR